MADTDTRQALICDSESEPLRSCPAAGVSGDGSPPLRNIVQHRKPFLIAAGVILLVALVAAVVVGVLVTKRRHNAHHRGGGHPSARACSIFCDSPILSSVQRRAIFNDSKHFVDMPLKADPEVVLSAWKKQGLDHPSTTDSQVRAFIHKYFDDPGSDLIKWTPPDYTENPPVLARVSNASMKAWIRDVNKLWLVLGRKVSPSVAKYPQRHSLLNFPHPVVVPGGRFREPYYWDSAFIISGLLACGMSSTAKGMVLNLVAEIMTPAFGMDGRAVGFVPNGGRVYYLNRSQPPLLSEMVLAVDIAINDPVFLRQCLEALDVEYAFWMKTGAGGNAVVLEPANGTTPAVILNRYVTSWHLPRPESWLEDYSTALQTGYGPNSSQAQAMYAEIAAMAESGWDFSSRWLKNSSSLASARTSDILPVELNAIMWRVERNLAHLHAKAGSSKSVVSKYTAAAEMRLAAIEKYLWSQEDSMWYDYLVSSRAPHKQVSVSNFIPMWAGCWNTSDVGMHSRLLASLEASNLIREAGLTTTLMHTGQQWDAPNAWAPLQYWIILGLQNSPLKAAQDLGLSIAQRWIKTEHLAYLKSGFMYEKYNADVMGEGGGGGEYVPQVGFGWTNGVMLDLFQRFGDKLSS